MIKSGIRGYAAIDCEMVETVGCENALARVSIGKSSKSLNFVKLF